VKDVHLSCYVHKKESMSLTIQKHPIFMHAEVEF
jgi:hypothetical protein